MLLSLSMLVNIVSDSQWSPTLWGGIHTAFLNYTQLLRKKKIQFVINSFGKADVTHIHSVGFFGLYKLLTSKNTIVTSHITPDTHAGTFKMGPFGYKLTTIYLRFFYNRATLIIALSEKVKQDLRKIGVTKEMVVIPNPINSDEFKKDADLRLQGRKLYGIGEKEFVVIGVGHAISRKGLDDFISIAKMVPTCRFIWVGGKIGGMLGAESEQINALLAEAPKNFQITGHVPYKKMALFYNAADVLLFPTYKEIASMVTIEAAACGLPVVLRDLPEYRELYETNFLACSDNTAFKHAVEQLKINKKLYVRR